MNDTGAAVWFVMYESRCDGRTLELPAGEGEYVTRPEADRIAERLEAEGHTAVEVHYYDPFEANL